MAKNNQENENLRFYEKLRAVPTYALKKIGAGRLSGMSDINPVFRIKTMTETFGPCGIGWKYEITKQWQETYGQEVKSFTNINLYIKVDGQWSEPIPGTGGATIVEQNSRGIYVNDEGHKMSLTDALSVAMKALGVAADIYYAKDKEGQFDTKYEQQSYAAKNSPVSQPKTAQRAAASAQPASSLFELQEAFELIKPNIETAPSKAYLMDIYTNNPALHNYQPFMDAMTKRKKEVA